MSQALFLRLAAVAMTLVLSACANSTYDKSAVAWLSPYRFDRVQGNVVTREQLDALKPGMTRNQIRDLLGTPLLTSVFRTDRWDYAFTLVRQNAAPQSRHVTVFFNADVMDHVDAGDVPTEDVFVAQIGTKVEVGKLPLMVATPESLQTFMPPPTPMPVALPPLPDSYPPLEPAQQ